MLRKLLPWKWAQGFSMEAELWQLLIHVPLLLQVHRIHLWHITFSPLSCLPLWDFTESPGMLWEWDSLQGIRQYACKLILFSVYYIWFQCGVREGNRVDFIFWVLAETQKCIFIYPLVPIGFLALRGKNKQRGKFTPPRARKPLRLRVIYLGFT